MTEIPQNTSNEPDSNEPDSNEPDSNESITNEPASNDNTQPNSPARDAVLNDSDSTINDPPASEAAGSLAIRSPWRWQRVLSICGIVAVIGSGVFFYVRVESSLSTAKTHAAHRKWSSARAALERYLKWHPSHAESRWLMAKWLVQDSALKPTESALLAIESLARIPADSEYHTARVVREARLRFLILNQPTQAEVLLRQALQLEDDRFGSHADANYLMWKLLDMTERANSSEPFFWNFFAATPPRHKIFQLRAWYLSQFQPGAANEQLDRRMGFLEATEKPNQNSEFKRLLAFQLSEPDSLMMQVAMVLWFQRTGSTAEAKKLLRDAARKPGAEQSPFFIAVGVSVLFDLGEFDEAVELFERWPSEPNGYDYWTWKARLADEVHQRYEDAIHAYDQLTNQWPGQTDWPAMFRRAQCLDRIQQHTSAKTARERATVIRKLMEDTTHRRLRKRLANISNSETRQAMSEFYAALGRPREAQLWLDVAASRSSSVLSKPLGQK